jgi:predicted NBD/HSP70 family sugar kinase
VVVWSTGVLRVAVVTMGGTILAERTVDMDARGAAGGVLDTALPLLDEATAEAELGRESLTRVVMGVPAPFQRGVGIPVRRPDPAVTRKFAPWLHTDPAEELSRRTGVPAVVENDANLGALGEYTFGAGRGQDSMVYIKLVQHSVGAGLVINGRLHRGATGFAGELAHIQVRDDGPLCACGGRGCLVNTIGPAVVDLAQPAYEQPLTFARMLADAAGGDAGLRRILGDLGRTVGRSLADLCTMLNPSAIVMDGALGEGGRYITDGVAEMVDRYAAPAAASAVRILPGTLGVHADVLGAVALAREDDL